MPKFSLVKTIEAKKLNRRTGVPTTDPAVTVPFGAIIDNVDTEGDTRRFTYQGELYRVAEDVLLSAVDHTEPPAANGSAASAPAPAQAPAPAPAPAPAVETADAPSAPDVRMRWEQVPSSHYQVLRAKLPGGWLVSTGASALAFYPDPQHAWDGSTEA